MKNAPAEQDEIETIKLRFLALTGLTRVAVQLEPAGLARFLRFSVGTDAPLYRRALERIDRELHAESPFHGALSLRVEKPEDILQSTEIELLRSLIAKSLRVTTDTADEGLAVDFVPFRGGEDQRAIQPTNHAILGRRGVGKSTLILMVYRRVLSDGNLPVWIDLQPYRARTDNRAAMEVFRDVLEETIRIAKPHVGESALASMLGTLRQTDQCLDSSTDLDETRMRQRLPTLRAVVRDFTRDTKKQIFVFLDDAHLVGARLQPYLFDFLHSVFKGSGAWLNIAGVKNLLRLYDPTSHTGLQSPNDVQHVSLDLTLVDPGAARDHLTSVLQQFLDACGFAKSGRIIPDRAIDRLVWCSAGVPRDFLSLLDRSIGFALQHRRKKVGVMEVNLAVGDFGQEKMAELEQDTSEGRAALQESLDRLKENALDVHRSNCFLIRLESKHPGYAALQKLVDLRLVHLIHPSITPSTAGERYEAYLLDYSFYTGRHRRHGLSELKINVDEPLRYSTLRKLPRIDLDRLCACED